MRSSRSNSTPALEGTALLEFGRRLAQARLDSEASPWSSGAIENRNEPYKEFEAGDPNASDLVVAREA